MKDEELKTQTDYVAGQREAARRVLIEIGNILHDFRNKMMVIGGWVPDLYFPDKGHIGSIDVDLLLDHNSLVEASYATIKQILLKNGYTPHPEKYFSFVREIEISRTVYKVDLDILAGKYGGTTEEKNSQHVQGVKAPKATGGNFAFDIPAMNIEIEGQRPDGAKDGVGIQVVSIVAFLVMKTAALGRGKPKDAYDIYFCVRYFPNGIEELAKLFEAVKNHGLVVDMCQRLRGKFASPEHAGPKDIADFLDYSDEETIEQLKRDAFERITRLLDFIEK